MPIAAPSPAEIALLAPEIFLCGAAFALLVADLFIRAERKGLTHLLALLALLGTGIFVARGFAMQPVLAFGELFVRDTVSDVLKLAMLVVTGAAMVYAKPYLEDRGLLKGEFYILVLFAALGMMLMVSAASLVVLYLGLELLALCSYGLVALDRDNRIGSEAAMKYFVLGALASGLLLYGMSMLYGATGSLQLAAIDAAAGGGGERALLLFGVVFVLVGIAFKFGAAPFHMWLPDAYHGAPTAVTLFIGSAPKLAAFGMAYRLLETGSGSLDDVWPQMLSWLAALSLILGNLIALAQSNLKRMLAYSTISHVGFLFLGLANAGPGGYAAAMFYAISYAVMAAAGFGAIILLSRQGFEADQIADFRGLWQTRPFHAWMVLFVLASMAGVPPFLGFWAKLAVLMAALDAGMLWLAILGMVCAVVGAFYYLRVIWAMFFDAPVGAGPETHRDSHLRGLFALNALALLALGVLSDPLMAWCRLAFAA
jgi:NADH-quinone oxidoreductase subunit N